MADSPDQVVGRTLDDAAAVICGKVSKASPGYGSEQLEQLPSFFDIDHRDESDFTF